jgi:hypothetical protein
MAHKTAKKQMQKYHKYDNEHDDVCAVAVEVANEEEDDENVNEYEDSAPTYDIFGLAKDETYESWHEFRAYVFTKSYMASQLVDKLTVWDYNRYLNTKHKDIIKATLFAQREPIIHGEICIVCDNIYRGVVINGQHRLAAIKELIAEHRPTKYDIKLCLRIIKLNDVANIMSDSPDVIKIIANVYEIINMTLPMHYNNVRELKAIELADALAAASSNISIGIVRNFSGKTVHKPRITYKAMKDYIYKYLPKDFSSINAKTFTEAAQLKNNELMALSCSELYGRANPAADKEKHHAKACAIKFYLNLDGRGSPDRWLPLLFTAVTA